MFQYYHNKEDILSLATSISNIKQSSSNNIEIIILAFYNYIPKDFHLQTAVYAFLFTVFYLFSRSFLSFYISK